MDSSIAYDRPMQDEMDDAGARKDAAGIRVIRNRFLCREESWGCLLQDMQNDRLWATDEPTLQRVASGDTTLPLFSSAPYRHEGEFTLGSIPSKDALSAPISISWSITSRCNSRCQFCCTDSIHADSGEAEASLQKIETVLDVLLRWKVMRIILGGGEPLVRPDIREILALFRVRSFKPALATNGILLHGELLEDVARTCMTIQISLDTLDRERYHKLRGVDALEIVKRHILAAAETGVLVRVVTVLTTENIQELEAIGAFLAEAGVRQWFIFEMLGAGRGAACYDRLHVSDNDRVSAAIAGLEREYPHFSAWYWGNQPADGCAVYVVPDGSLALADYHANSIQKLSARQLNLDIVQNAWRGIAKEDKSKMLDNFLAENRLREADALREADHALREVDHALREADHV